jgi:hypothetical protein
MSQPEPSPPATAPRRFHWRRLFQYRLRTLLIVMTLIAVWFAWWSHKARQQRVAVGALRSMGAEVRYDSRWPWTGWMKRPPEWPRGFLCYLGDDYFASVRDVVFWDGATDADLHNLADFTALKELWLKKSHVTDKGLEYISRLATLKVLSIDGSQVTDGGMKRLHASTSLEWLDLENTDVSDAGLAHLKGLTALTSLNLRSTKVTDAGLEYLKGLKALEYLNLENTLVTDAGAQRLREELRDCTIAH